VGFEPATFFTLGSRFTRYRINWYRSVKKVAGSKHTQIENFFPDKLFVLQTKLVLLGL
jgi:hypothetical protein